MDALSFVSEPKRTQIKNRISPHGMTVVVFNGDTRTLSQMGQGFPQVKIITNTSGYIIRDHTSALRERHNFLECLPKGCLFTAICFWNGQYNEVCHLTTKQSTKPTNDVLEDFSSDFFKIAPRTGSVGLNEFRATSHIPYVAPAPLRRKQKKNPKTAINRNKNADPADRSKHADGHMARENTGYGSMPLHDDYGDEATGNERD